MIQLTQTELETLRQVQAVSDKLNVLIQAGVFEIRNGYAQIHFDNDGNIGAIQRHDRIYKR